MRRLGSLVVVMGAVALWGACIDFDALEAARLAKGFEDAGTVDGGDGGDGQPDAADAGSANPCELDGGLTPGTPCGLSRVCDSLGQCTICVQNVGCTSNPSAPCKAGVVSCTTGAAQCIDGTDAPNGTNCGLDKVCQVGTCINCQAGAVCSSNPTPCKRGSTVCSPLVACADNGNVAAGVACGSGQVCDGNGSCQTCVAGQSCSTNPGAPCKSGVTDCSTGTQRCIDIGNASAGTTCGTNQVCNGSGTCVVCQANAPCIGNPSLCRAGMISCITGAPACVDGSNLGAGTSCGSNKVCDSNGFCGACIAGQSCTSNPGGTCKQGVTSCTGGVTQCVDGAAATAGVACGAGQVCNSTGSCVACGAGQACVGNPNACAMGVTSCATGAQICVDGTARAPGISCGTNQVCSGTGVCNACTSNAVCSTNPSPCLTGVTSCASGASQCVDYASKAAGTSCGTNQICNGSGQCQSCTAGLSCSGNPNACAVGITSCASGTQACVDGASTAPGTVCGANQVCNLSGTCAACSGGQSCGTNPNAACFTGVTSCSTGVTTCVDSVQRAPGTSCGVSLVCNGVGACTACTAAASCATNPNVCRNGLTSCSTGAQTCIDSTAKTAGLSCGANQVCNGSGGCVACVAGQACTTNPTACLTGVTSCSTGSQTCVDTATAKTPGTSCGTNQVCTSAGTCVACTAGQTCFSNPNSACFNGITLCSTGVSTCVDGTSKTPGTSCGANQVCNSAGVCSACIAGQACTTNPGAPAKPGITDCSLGTLRCIDA